MPIRQLSAETVNRIAAGEVIERPGSVVKELTENALDAGARDIEVVTAAGGLSLIRVTDDGEGMGVADLALAVERHATSKLAGEDLFNIATLGFRGEALPSIGAIARLSIKSRPRDASTGHEIVVDRGAKQAVRPAALNPGTAVEVRELFSATPARLKFLKSERAENMAISEVVKRLAMAHPSVGFTLTTGERAGLKLVAQPLGPDGHLARLGRIMGRDFLDDALPVDIEREGVRVTGFAGLPTLHRPDPGQQYLFVNGRPVKDKLLIGAVRAAYGDLLPKARYPLLALYVALPPREVDVNVHPAKTWVRFRRPRVLYGVVLDAVKAALRQLDAAPAGLSTTLVGSGAEGGASVLSTPGWGGGADPGQASLFREGEPGYRSEPFFGRVVGQIEDTFIVAHTADEVFFVDQHVAHERVLFERLRGELDRGTLASQELLFPQPLELAPARVRALERVQPQLERLGFAVEGFGGAALLLRAAPSLLRAEDLPRLADELAQELDEDAGRGSSPVLDRMLAFVACRAAIKAHQALAPEQMAQVLTDLAETATPYYCPHGRPIVSRIPLGEIKRELRRTW